MIQIILLVVSVLLVVLGVKGFTPSGLKLSKETILTGSRGKVVGAICIALGVGLIPLFMLLTWMYSEWLRG